MSHINAEHYDAFVRGEEIDTTKLPSFDAITTDLLKNEKINELPEEEQGRVIVDRFIGSIVRHGELSGSQTTYSPADILKLIDSTARSEEDSKYRVLTSTNQLRSAVQTLAEDPRVASEIGEFESRIGRNEAGQLVFTSIAQIEGYLMPGAHVNHVSESVPGSNLRGDEWVSVAMGEVQRITGSVGEDWVPDELNRNLATSEVPLVRNAALDRITAAESAKAVGVDIDLIRRSAEKIQGQLLAQRDMGAVALSLASDGIVDSYKNNLDRRSGY